MHKKLTLGLFIFIAIVLTTTSSVLGANKQCCDNGWVVRIVKEKYVCVEASIFQTQGPTLCTGSETCNGSVCVPIGEEKLLHSINQAQQNIAPNLPPPGSSISTLLSSLKIFDFVFFIIGLIFFVNLVLAAWDYILSSGDPKKISAGTQRLLNAVIGIVVVFASFIIVRVILAILGLSSLI